MARATARKKAETNGPRLVAAFGGLLLMTSLAPPIDWLKEVSTGGLSGYGTGEPPEYLSAWNELGPWSLLVAGAGIAGIAGLWIREWPGSVGWLFIAAGILTLVIALVIATTGDVAEFPDQVYEQTQIEEGALLAVLGAALVAGGAVGSAIADRQRAG